MATWQTKNKPSWWTLIVSALWNDAIATWNSLTIAWDATEAGKWQTKNKPSWYTNN